MNVEYTVQVVPLLSFDSALFHLLDSAFFIPWIQSLLFLDSSIPIRPIDMTNVLYNYLLQPCVHNHQPSID